MPTPVGDNDSLNNDPQKRELPPTETSPASDPAETIPIADAIVPGTPGPPLPLPEGHHFIRILRRIFIGGKRSLREPGVYHKMSLVALLAWVGLGADGLSSSSYGPEEAFKALGQHTYLAVMLAVATAFTVSVIAYAYSQIIEYFPFGGGGYVVASRNLGQHAGLVSGSALIIDYILTIAISVAAGADAVFSFLPPDWQHGTLFGFFPPKLGVEFAAVGLLVLLNLRGVKESVTTLTPIFATFIITHAILIVGAIAIHAPEIPGIGRQIGDQFSQGLQAPPLGLGMVGMLALFLRAYSMGAGTYTGIEAVSNGLMIMREPRVATGKRTMFLMATSLSITAAGLIIAYLLLHITPVAGKTMNAVLAEKFSGVFNSWGMGASAIFVTLTLLSEALLLFVAAQAGFLDGPRVMSNMAHDSWMPHRFSSLSDRLTMQNGILIMGVTSLVALIYTRGAVTHLVVMYSINVFLTFSLTELSMCRFWIRQRRDRPDWTRKISIHLIGLVLCVSILAITIFEKFGQGGWITLAVTVGLIILCLLIRRHYNRVIANLRRLDTILAALPAKGEKLVPPIDPKQPTAVLLVGAYAGLGVHSLLAIQRLFPNHFRNFVFLSAGVIDSATFSGVEAVDEMRERTEESLRQYVGLANRLGLAADYRLAVGTETVDTAEELCKQVAREFPRTVFFAGKLLFQEERWFQRLLHNETAYQLQRRLQFSGLNAMVLPVRVLEYAPVRKGA